MAPDVACSISLPPFVGLAGQPEIQEGGCTTGDLRFMGRYVQLKPRAAQAVPPPMSLSIQAGRRKFSVGDDTRWNRASRERHGHTHCASCVGPRVRHTGSSHTARMGARMLRAPWMSGLKALLDAGVKKGRHSAGKLTLEVKSASFQSANAQLKSSSHPGVRWLPRYGGELHCTGRGIRVTFAPSPCRFLGYPTPRQPPGSPPATGPPGGGRRPASVRGVWFPCRCGLQCGSSSR